MATPFPGGLAGDDIAGVCVASADSFAAGCIEAYLSDHVLSAQHRDVLTRVLQDLRRAAPHLEGPQLAYVDELAGIVEQVLREAPEKLRPDSTQKAN